MKKKNESWAQRLVSSALLSDRVSVLLLAGASSFPLSTAVQTASREHLGAAGAELLRIHLPHAITHRLNRRHDGVSWLPTLRVPQQRWIIHPRSGSAVVDRLRLEKTFKTIERDRPGSLSLYTARAIRNGTAVPGSSQPDPSPTHLHNGGLEENSCPRPVLLGAQRGAARSLPEACGHSTTPRTRPGGASPADWDLPIVQTTFGSEGNQPRRSKQQKKTPRVRRRAPLSRRSGADGGRAGQRPRPAALKRT